MLMLTLDDAVKVTKRLVEDGMNDEEIIRQELEQKCWIPSFKDPESAIHELIFDINPAEITKQIFDDRLKRWCENIQVAMQLAVRKMVGEEE